MSIPVVLLVAGLAASLAGAALLRRRDPNVLKDDKPSTTARRGDYLPLVTGRAIVGPVVLWVGESFTKQEEVRGGGKGGKRQKQRIYYEKAWHGLCVGPAFRLHRIRQNGETIFEGPIDSESHPPGSTIETGKHGAFSIFWGEEDQPINTFLQPSTRVGVGSRWPFLCYIVWHEKRLGLSKNWALLDYEIEVLPFGSTLVRTSAFQGPSFVLNGMPRPVFTAMSGGPGQAQLATIVIDGGDFRREFPPGGRLRLTGNSAGDADHKILGVSYTRTPGIPPVERTTITLADDLTNANNQGNVEGYLFNEDDGVNPVHVLDQLMREPFPHGLGGMDGAVADISADSLEALAQLMVVEGIVGHVVAEDGETAQSAIAGILTDLGAVVSLEHISGLWQFRAVRKPVPPIPILPADVILDPEPEIENQLGPRPVDRAIFEFLDREKNFRTNEVAFDGDGQAALEGHSKPKKIAMEIPIHYRVAEKIADRRSLETNAHGNRYEIKANRSTRLMMPGRAFVASGIAQVLRLVEKRIDPLTSDVTLVASTDVYGVRAQTFIGDPKTPDEPDTPDPILDPEGAIFEIPPPLKRDDEPLVAPLRIRDNDRIRGADIFVSEDDVTYAHVGFVDTAATGGRLLEPLSATTDDHLETGPIFQLLGPDGANIRDFSLDPISWHRGRQLVVSGNGEICLLRNVVALGGGQYRLTGLIRARLQSKRVAHVVNEPVFIVDPRLIVPLRDASFEPGATLYFKIQPFTLESQGIPLSEIPALQHVIEGHGVVPLDPANLFTTNQTNSYIPGESPVFTWSFRSPLARRGGAGYQGYGKPTAAAQPFGTFRLRYRDTFSGTVRGESSGILRPPFTYANSVLQGHFGGEPSEFDVEVVNVANGFESAKATARILLD